MSTFDSSNDLSQKRGVLPINGDTAAILQLPDSDKKILAINLGSLYCVARVNTELELDLSFGPDGNGYIEDSFGDFGFPAAATVSLQGDKLLIVGAYFDFFTSIDHLALARYDLQGNVDTTFGDNGKVVVTLPEAGRRRLQGRLRSGSNLQICRDPIVQADGKILFFLLEVSDADPAGRAFLIRLTADGDLDDTFNGRGFQHVTFGGYEINPSGVQLQDDQRILVYGGIQAGTQGTSTQNAVIARYDDQGGLDTTFNSTGFVTEGREGQVSRFTALLIDANKRIVATGDDGNELLMVRRLENGGIDPSFNKGLPAVIQLPVAVEILPTLQVQRGALVLAGTCYQRGTTTFRGLLLRLLPEGELDTSFADGQGFLVAEPASQWFALAIESDDQIVTAGYVYDQNYRAWIQRVGIEGR